MFESVEVAADDAVTCAEGLVGSLIEQRLVGATRFAWIARWADLHEPERLVRRQGRVEARRCEAWDIDTAGIPVVTKAGVAELAVLLQISTRTAERLLRDVLEIRHRLPLTWHGVMTGEVEDWKARQLAKATRMLTPEQAQRVDRELGDVLATLPWGRVLPIVEAKVIAVDPTGHEARLRSEEAKTFVSTRRRSNSFGLRTMVARGTAGDVARLEAMISHLADLLKAAGDTDVADTRRAKALALLANPALACVFLAGMVPTAPPATDSSLPGTEVAEAGGEVVAAAPPSAAELARELGRLIQGLGAKAIDLLRPTSILHLHISDAAVWGNHDAQVARVDDPVAAGPIGVEQLREWLQNDRVVVRPVFIPLEAVAADCYEIPAAISEAQVLLTPVEVFPYGTQPARQADEDHTIPYVPPDEGGPPGQTAIGNLGPLGRTHHLLKTFAGFAVHQPAPGLYYWRTPTGWWYQVDHTGTRPLGRNEPAAVRAPLANANANGTNLSPMEETFRRAIVGGLAA
jgi:hypothetical protein